MVANELDCVIKVWLYGYYLMLYTYLVDVVNKVFQKFFSNEQRKEGEGDGRGGADREKEGDRGKRRRRQG